MGHDEASFCSKKSASVSYFDQEGRCRAANKSEQAKTTSDVEIVVEA